MNHPSLDITGSDGTELAGKRVVLCVSGSVAAYKSIELARLMMRRGAEVRCVLSEAASRLITPEYFTWATGQETVTFLSGRMEHIQLTNYSSADVIVAYPATANTIGKLANGIDDTALSTVLATGLASGIPMIVAPAMHEVMYQNPAVRRNLASLEGHIRLVPPVLMEDKAKVAEPPEILESVMDAVLRPSSIKGKRVLLIAGPTIERIDPVRAVTNTSSGRTGVLMADELFRSGCDITMVYGPGRERPPASVRLISVTTVKEMMEVTLREAALNYDIIVMAAAAADYSPAEYRREKIDSGFDTLDVRLAKTPKIIDHIRAIAPDSVLVGFKAEVNTTEEQLVATARQKMREARADIIVANDVGDGYQNDPDNNRVIVVDADGHTSSGRKRKEDVVMFIREKIEEHLARRTT